VRRLFILALSLVIAAVGAVDVADAKKKRKKKPWTTGATIVKTDLGQAPGTIVIVNEERRLDFVIGKGQSKRYRVAVGEKLERWTGKTFVSRKKVDPDWHPVDGSPMVKGGTPSNPLGKRALYIDWSLLRIHGTPYRRSIGGAVSNGCIRMFNEDVIDLYDRVHIGAPIIAVNRKRDLIKFADVEFTGKQPSWDGQERIWKAQAREDRNARREGRKPRRVTVANVSQFARDERAQRRSARRNRSSSRASTRRSRTQRSVQRRYRR
jgi:hypothetical protein